MINIDPPYIEMRKFVAAWVHIKSSQEHVYKFNRNLPYIGMRCNCYLCCRVLLLEMLIEPLESAKYCACSPSMYNVIDPSKQDDYLHKYRIFLLFNFMLFFSKSHARVMSYCVYEQ